MLSPAFSISPTELWHLIGTADAPQELLALAREHRAADDVERATAGGEERDHGGSLRGLSDVGRRLRPP